MNIIHAATELPPGSQQVCLAIGVFDGVHLGHQEIIRQTVADARRLGAHPLVVTFDRHPNAIVAPDREPPRIFTRPQKLRAIAALGVGTFLEIPFDLAFSRKSAEEFIRELARTAGPIRSICVGANFVFGHRRGGTVDLLKKLGAELDFQVHGLPAVALDGLAVSSTRIRETIRTGDLDAASQMLGRPYVLGGPVVAGDRLGRQLGFPTANLDTTGLVLPPSGVYAAETAVSGQTYRVALNIGHRPTLNNPRPQLRVEAHLLDFTGDLYGTELELVPLARLRAEMKFGSLPELREQIARDVAAVRLADGRDSGKTL